MPRSGSGGVSVRHRQSENPGRRRLRAGAMIAAAAILVASGLVASGARRAEAADDLVIAVPNWPSGQATANILKVAIARTFGLKAELRPMGELSAFAGLESGEIDIHPEVWRPNLDAAIEKYVDGRKAVVLAMAVMGQSSLAYSRLWSFSLASVPRNACFVMSGLKRLASGRRPSASAMLRVRCGALPQQTPR